MIFDNSTFSGGKFSHLDSEVGPNVDTEVGIEPLEGAPLLNGMAGVIMDTLGARMILDDAIAAGSHNQYTFAVVKWPDNGVGYADREYDADFHNNSMAPSDHMGFAHQANVVPFDKVGMFPGDTWRTIAVAPTFRPQVFVTRFDAGDSSYFRTGVHLGTDSGADVSVGLDEVYLGASYGTAPVTQHFKGSYYEMAMWTSALTDDQIDAYMDEVIDTYGLDNSEYLPTDNAASLTLWLSSAGKYAAGNTLYEGTELVQWSDLSGNGHHMQQNNAGQEPDDGVRINGRPSVATDSGRWMGAGQLSTFFPALDAAHSIMGVIEPASITATDGTAVDVRDVILADSGDYLAICAFMDSGTASISVYHYGSSTHVVKDSGIALNTKVLFHVWFDGATLHLRVGNRAAVTTSAEGISSLAGSLRFGRSWNGAGTFDGSTGDLIIRNAADSGEMDADRAYLGRVYGVAY